MARHANPEGRKAKIEERQAARAAARRATQYPLRLNAAERGALETAAQAAGVTPATFLRGAFLAPGRGTHAGGQGGGRPVGLDPAALSALSRIGSNLNQLTRRVNAGDGLQPGELPQALSELNATLARIEALVFAQLDP